MKILIMRMLMDWRSAGELWELYKRDPPSVRQQVLYKRIVQVRPTRQEKLKSSPHAIVRMDSGRRGKEPTASWVFTSEREAWRRLQTGVYTTGTADGTTVVDEEELSWTAYDGNQ